MICVSKISNIIDYSYSSLKNEVSLDDKYQIVIRKDVNEKWTLRTNTNKYWKLEASNGIQSTGDSKYNIITSILLCNLLFNLLNYFCKAI